MSAPDTVSNIAPLHIESTGQGEDVVLLHGWGMHGAYWQELIDSLKDQYRLHSIDLPGHGKSSYANESSLDDFVGRIASSIELVTNKPFHLIGWSLGGLIGQQLCIRRPERINKCVLIASSPCFVQRPDWPHAMVKDVLNGFAENLSRDYKTTLVRFLALQVWGSDDQKQALRELKQKLFSHGEPDARALNTGLSLLQNVDLREAMQQMQQDVLLIGGERDTLVPSAGLLDFSQALNASQIEIIKGAGHAPFISHAGQVSDLIRKYLQA